MNPPLLEVRGLEAGFPGPAGGPNLVRGVSFDVRRNEVLGLIGESGSGKTMTTSAILRLLPEGIEARADDLHFAGTDLQQLDARAFEAFRGIRLAMIFQDPTGAFNPAKTIGWHMRAVMKRSAARSEELRQRAQNWRPAAVALLEDVGIPRGNDVLGQFPHQLSGGMLQRALIAIVLALEPDLIVADEPTTNLDNIVERQTIEIFRQMKDRLDAALIFITHDISIARVLCDRMAVMYAGQIIETGTTEDILDRPRHPYTQGLIAASTELDAHPHRLTEIPGEGQRSDLTSARCSFEPRCALARAECRDGDPGMRQLSDFAAVRCVLYDQV